MIRSFIVLRWIALACFGGLLSGCSGTQLMSYHVSFQRWSADLERRVATIDGYNVSYLRSKSGVSKPVVVLLHGFGSDKDIWNRFSQYLSDDFDIVALDLPGHGESFSDPNFDYYLVSQARFVKRFLDSAGVSNPIMVGNSMGGAVAALYAALFSDDVSGLVLLNPAGVLRYQSVLTEGIVNGDNLLIPENEGDYDALVRLSFEDPPFIPEFAVRVIEQRLISRKVVLERIFSEMADITLSGRFVEYLGEIQCKTLLIWGEEDRLLNPDNSEVFLEHLRDVRLVTLEDVGHVPMFEKPKYTAELFADFSAELNFSD